MVLHSAIKKIKHNKTKNVMYFNFKTIFKDCWNKTVILLVFLSLTLKLFHYFYLFM